MLVKRDKDIISHIDEFGFLTISQAFLIWFSDINYGYDLARKHLTKIEKARYIQGYKPKGNMENLYAEKIYFMDDKYAIPTKSMVLAMNVYAEIIRLGANMIYYHREEPWQDRKYRSDAYAIFNVDRKIYSAAIEIINTTKWTAHKKSLSSKYKDIFSTNEPLEKMKTITNFNKNFDPPKLVIVSEIKTQMILEDIKQISVDYSLKGLIKMII